jgi:hypothetical protein
MVEFLPNRGVIVMPGTAAAWEMVALPGALALQAGQVM